LKRKKGWRIFAVHINPGFPNWQTQKIQKTFESINIPYLISDIDVPKKLTQISNERFSACFFCARERRKRLFEIADKQGIKKIALAHHLEDVNETYFLNLIYTSKTATFIPKQDFFRKHFFIIRPLYYFDKSLILRYFKAYELPPITNHCPYEKGNSRERIRRFLNGLYKKDSRIKTNIFWGIKNVKLNYLP
jgi:tRNA 2-thiocytidine biosynthesis protein TtcA